MEGRRKIILFDGVCNLCDHFVNFVFANDHEKHFYFASQQSVAGHEIMRRYNLRTDLKTVYYVEEETSQTWEQSSAVLRVCSYFTTWWRFLYFFMIVPAFIRNFCYKIIAGNRYRLWGTHDTCGYRPGLRKRFLEGGLIEHQAEAPEGLKEV